MDDLISYGKEILKEIEFKKVIGYIEDYKEFDIDYFRRFIDIDDYDYEILEKTSDGVSGYFMKWHFDNASLIKHKSGFKFNVSNDDKQISTRHVLHYYLKKPIFTLIVYESEHGIDFTGGILEFVDGTCITPKCGTFVLFDSRELHRVSVCHNIEDKERKLRLVKFYSKFS